MAKKTGTNNNDTQKKVTKNSINMSKIRYACEKCGEISIIGLGTTVCPVCGVPIAHIPSYEELKKKTNEAVEKFEGSIKNYEESGKSKEIITIVQGYANYIDILNFENHWRDFIVSAMGASVSKNDDDLSNLLKKHAKVLDEKIEDIDLYRSVLQAYPNVGNINDWRGLIEETQGDNNQFSALCADIIKYIVSNKDRAFAIGIFNLIKAGKKEWANAGATYISALTNNAEITNNVFTVSAFNGRCCKFARNLKKYISGYLKNDTIEIEETKLWENYQIARKRRKRRNIIIFCSVAAVVLASGAAAFFVLNATNKDSVKFNIDKVIETTYGEELDLSDFSVTYKKNMGTEMSEPITLKMLKGYDPELVGNQQEVTVEFGGASTTITVMVNVSKLVTPVVTQSGNYVSWEFVPNADNYSVYINSSAAPVTTTTTLSYDLSTDVNYGNLSVTVRANTTSEKYSNSEMSQPLSVTKLQPPTGLKYDDGALRWDAVAGADIYELVVGGTPYTANTNSLTLSLAQGETSVKIVSKSNNSSVVVGVTEKVVSYYKLSPISDMYYSDGKVYWTAEERAGDFSVYVDGTYWKNFSRSYFDVEQDGFTKTFSEDAHKIEIVSSSSILGIEDSVIKGFTVSLGNKVYIEDNVMKWNSVGTGATYFVNAGGQDYSLSAPNLPLSSVTWSEGANVVKITANFNGETIICETITVTKLGKPSVSVVGSELYTETNDKNRFSVNGGEWTSTVPDLSSFGTGEFTVKAKRVSSAQFEIDSEEVSVKIYRPETPVIAVTSGKVDCPYDSGLYDLNLYYCETIDGTYRNISSLASIVTAGEYYLKANLTSKEGALSQYDYVLASGYSTPLAVTKLETPSVSYTQGDERITSNDARAKFYYVYNDEECECEGGLIANLPAGVITVYARVNATNANEISSENTPADQRASIYNLNITLSLSKYGDGDYQFYVVFGGCAGTDSLTFTYEIKYYDSNGTYVGCTPKTTEKTAQKTGVSEDNIITTINYRLGATFEAGYGHTDIKKVVLIVYISSGTNVLQKSAEMII
ncbi:MAG: hypothetical protein ACI4MH_04655 [Candidatus Coproplasma sp.]